MSSARFWPYLGLSVVAFVSLAPLLYMARVSLGVGGDLPVAPSDWWGKPLTLEHYRSLASGGPMGRFAINSLVVSCVAVPIQLLLAAAAGHALARSRFLGKGLTLGLATAFLVLPRQVTLIPLYLLMARLGLLDTYRGAHPPAPGRPLRGSLHGALLPDDVGGAGGRGPHRRPLAAADLLADHPCRSRGRASRWSA